MSVKKKTNMIERGNVFQSGFVPIADLFKNAAATGLSKRDMANLLGVHENTLYRHLAKDKELKDAMESGDAKLNRYMVSKLFEEAVGGRPYKKVVIKESAKNGREVITTMGVSQCRPNLMMFWLTNRCNEHFKHVRQTINQTTEDKKYTYELSQSDQIAKLVKLFSESDSPVIEGECVVPQKAPRELDGGPGDAASVQGVVCGQATDSVQDDAVDVPAKERTEPA